MPWFDIFYKVLNKLASLKTSCEPAATALLDQLHKVNVPGPGKQLRITVSEGGNTSVSSYMYLDTFSKNLVIKTINVLKKAKSINYLRKIYKF